MADQPPRDELERVRAESIDRLESGRLPVEAERRLRDLAGRKNFFTSDLTIDEFALGHELGIRPVSQVMGSCVYHAGIQADQSWIGWNPGSMTNMGYAAHPWNEARATALGRMSLEAQECGADAVIGVHVTRGEQEFDAASVEFLALGTAVRIKGAERAKQSLAPILTGLSGQEYWMLGRAGFVPAGVVSTTEIVGCVPSMATQQGQAFRFSSAGYQNRELTEFSEAVQFVTRHATDELAHQAKRHGADGIVGVHVEHHKMMVERDQSGIGGFGTGLPGRREDLIVMVHAMGTAIVEVGTPAAATGSGLVITPVRHLDSPPERSR